MINRLPTLGPKIFPPDTTVIDNIIKNLTDCLFYSFPTEPKPPIAINSSKVTKRVLEFPEDDSWRVLIDGEAFSCFKGLEIYCSENKGYGSLFTSGSLPEKITNQSSARINNLVIKILNEKGEFFNYFDGKVRFKKPIIFDRDSIAFDILSRDNCFWDYLLNTSLLAEKTEKKEVSINLAVAGYKREDIKVFIEGDALTIEGDNTHRDIPEKFQGQFSRVFSTKGSLDLSKAKVTLEDGLLSVEIPLKEPDDSRQYLFGMPSTGSS